MITVLMITYGHKKFIEQAIAGVLMQKTNFSVELIIANDCSPDNSDEVIQKAISELPQNISVNYIKNDKNLGPNPNFVNAFKDIKSKYIALCEGDDYWTDPLKLQKQVDFLEANEDYSVCFHNVEEVDINGKTLGNYHVISEIEEKTYTIEDLANGNFIHTPSVVFRNQFEELPDWFLYCPIGDYPLHLLNASYGKIKYIPSQMASYRVGAGIWSRKSHEYRVINTILTLTLLINNFPWDKAVLNNLNKQYESLVDVLKNIPNSTHTVLGNPENAAYNLSFKKLLTILFKKIRYLKK